MFADENSPFSFGSNDFFTGSEPRKSVGGTTGRLSDTFGSDELPPSSQHFGGVADSLSQEHAQSQRGSASSSSTSANQTGDACVCVTISLLKKALKARGETPAGSRGSGVLRVHGREAALVGLCGWVASVEVRPSLVRLVVQDGTGQIDVECSHGAAIAQASDVDSAVADSPWTVDSVVQVYGVACADDTGMPFVDACKVSKVTDMRIYYELFPMKVIAAALASKQDQKCLGGMNAEEVIEGTQESEDQEMSRYTHICDASQRAVLKALLRDSSHTIKREEIPLAAGISYEDAETALQALEEQGEIACTAAWATLSC